LSHEGRQLIEELKNGSVDLTAFSMKYGSWYTRALPAVEQLVSDRLEEFKNCHRPASGGEKTTTISTLLSIAGFPEGVRRTARITSVGLLGILVSIIESASSRLDSVLPNIRNLLQADMFASELDAAGDLLNNGHLRAAGVVAGVVLEGHLKTICLKNTIKLSKRKPTLSDYYQELYKAKVIGNSERTRLEHLSSLRNLCAHKGDREPNKQDVLDLIEGTQKVMAVVI